jgi:hypothetical protein
MMLYDVIWCYMMLYDAIWCYMMLYDAIWCYMMLYDAIWCYMMVYDGIWWVMMAIYVYYVLYFLSLFYIRVFWTWTYYQPKDLPWQGTPPVLLARYLAAGTALRSYATEEWTSDHYSSQLAVLLSIYLSIKYHSRRANSIIKCWVHKPWFAGQKYRNV